MGGRGVDLPDLQPGQVVLSLAGRDRGRRMIVLKVVDDRYVLVVDGELRRLQHPKRKNRRHLQPQGAVAHEVARKVAEGRPVTDAEVREALQRLAEGGRDGEEGRD